MTDGTDWPDVLAGYRRGARADILQAKVRGCWGQFWTVPACSPDAMERAGRQFGRSRAEAVRHYRLARLRSGAGPGRDVVILTILPGRIQQVRDLTSEDVLVVGFLEDAVTRALARAVSR